MLPSVDKSLVKTRKVSDDKPDGSPVNVNDEENDKAEENSDDELMNKEVLLGDSSDDRAAKGVDTLTIVTLLQTILAMMLLCVKFPQRAFSAYCSILQPVPA